MTCARAWRLLARSWAAQGLRQRQLGLTVLIPILKLPGFWAAARATGLALPIEAAVALMPLILLAMLLPITVNVWGVREAVATELLPLRGIDPAQGVAETVVFGPACMAAALAGLVPWLMADRRDTSAHSGDTQAALAIQHAEWDNF